MNSPDIILRLSPQAPAGGMAIQESGLGNLKTAPSSYLSIGFLFVLSIFFTEGCLAQETTKSPPGTETIYIPSDMLPPPSAESIQPKTPFYSQPTTGNEVLEDVEALKRRVDELEHSVEVLKRQVQGLPEKSPQRQKQEGQQ